MAIEGGAASLSPIDLTYQMQVLQQEVMSLRGLVEQLSHDIQKSKSIQEDRYLELDRRLQNQPASRQAAAVAPNIASVPADLPSSEDAQAPAVADELKSEQSYYDEGLTSIRARDYDQAIASLGRSLSIIPLGCMHRTPIIGLEKCMPPSLSLIMRLPGKRWCRLLKVILPVIKCRTLRSRWARSTISWEIARAPNRPSVMLQRLIQRSLRASLQNGICSIKLTVSCNRTR